MSSVTNLINPVAFFGGCWDGLPGSAITCTLDASKCTDPLIPFVSGVSHDMNPTDEKCFAEDITAKRCVDSENTLGTCIIGGCPGYSTIEDDVNCNLVKDMNEEVSTLYGGCLEASSKDFKGCFWSKKDCLYDDYHQETWLDPDFLTGFLSTEGGHSKDYCDCSDVRVGACRSIGGATVCAVDRTQCSEGETFLTARTLMASPDVYNDLDCRLCSSSEITDTMKANMEQRLKSKRDNRADNNAKSDSVDLGNDVDHDDDDDYEDRDDDDYEDKDDDMSGARTPTRSSAPESGTVAGAVLGSILGLLLLACIALVLHRVCNSGATNNKTVDEEAADESTMAIATGEMS